MKCIEMDLRLGCKVKYLFWKLSVCCFCQAPAFPVFPRLPVFPGFHGFPGFSALEAKCVLPLLSACFSSFSRWHCLLAEAYDQKKVFMKNDGESFTLFSSTKPK